MVVIFQQLELAECSSLVAANWTGGSSSESVVEVGFTEVNGGHALTTGVVNGTREFSFRLDADDDEVWVFCTGMNEMLSGFQRGMARLDCLNCAREVAPDEDVQIRCVFRTANLRTVHEILQVKFPVTLVSPGIMYSTPIRKSTGS